MERVGRWSEAPAAAPAFVSREESSAARIAAGETLAGKGNVFAASASFAEFLLELLPVNLKWRH